MLYNGWEALGPERSQWPSVGEYQDRKTGLGGWVSLRAISSKKKKKKKTIYEKRGHKKRQILYERIFCSFVFNLEDREIERSHCGWYLKRNGIIDLRKKIKIEI